MFLSLVYVSYNFVKQLQGISFGVCGVVFPFSATITQTVLLEGKVSPCSPVGRMGVTVVIVGGGAFMGLVTL